MSRDGGTESGIAKNGHVPLILMPIVHWHCPIPKHGVPAMDITTTLDAPRSLKITDYPEATKEPNLHPDDSCP